MSDTPFTATPSRPDPAIPLVIALIAFVGFLGFQTTRLLAERDSIAALRDSQTSPIAEGEKMRKQLENVAKQTVALAAQGNASAKAIIDDLARQGITITPQK
jgi:hypothetical protein